MLRSALHVFHPPAWARSRHIRGPPNCTAWAYPEPGRCPARHREGDRGPGDRVRGCEVSNQRWQTVRAARRVGRRVVTENEPVGAVSAGGAVFTVLLVCTGNICRSAMAERLGRAYLEEGLGEDARAIRIVTAGTPPSARANVPPPRGGGSARARRR